MVSIPITGIAYVEIEAPDNATDQEILDEAYENITSDNIEEWECTPHIMEGNFFNGIINNYDIEKEGEI